MLTQFYTRGTNREAAVSLMLHEYGLQFSTTEVRTMLKVLDEGDSAFRLGERYTMVVNSCREVGGELGFTLTIHEPEIMQSTASH